MLAHLMWPVESKLKTQYEKVIDFQFDFHFVLQTAQINVDNFTTFKHKFIRQFRLCV